MHSPDTNESSPARRRLLGAMASVAGVSAVGLLGLNATGAAASAPAAEGAMPAPPELIPAGPEELLAQARLRNYKNRRSSSWDRTGGNEIGRAHV